MEDIQLSGWKDPEAYEQNKPCYTDEQGRVYTRDDFLSVCNGDSQVALQLFQLCYWQTPVFQFALYDESIVLPTLSHHSKSAAHWLIWREDPTTSQQAALRQSGWTAQNTRTWMTEREEWSVPWGIAFRDTGTRDLTPQETAERRKEQARHETPLTERAQACYDQFKADVRESLTQMSQSTVYVVDQLPHDLDGWNRLEDINGRGLRALFLTHLAETPAVLWEALDRLPANCEFTVTELTNLHPTAQVKGRRRGGDIVKVRSRETESTLIPVFTAVIARINQEPPRERLLRRWRRTYDTREERITFEKHRIEWLPLHQQLYTDLVKDRQAETEEPAKTLLVFCGWQSAYTFALEILAVLPDEITEDLAQAFLADLVKQREETRAARSKAESSSLWSLIEEGRDTAFSALCKDASAFLIPGELTPDQGASLL
jgi:hypothetical protein